MSHPEKINPDPATNNNSEEINLLDLLVILAKNKIMILSSTFVVALVAVIYSLTLPNIYTAKVMVLPGDDDKGMMGAMMAQMGSLGALAGSAGLGGPTKADLYATMLNSEAIMAPIVDRYKLMEVYNTKRRYFAYKRLDKNSNIQVGKKDGIITIQIDDLDPKRAAAIANSYVDELGRLVARLNMTSAGNNRKFLEERLISARTDLTSAEDALKTFQTKNKAISVTDQARATIEGVAQLRAQQALQEVQLGTLQQQLTDSSQEVKSAKAALANLKSQITKLEGNSAGSSSIPNVGSVPGLGQEYLRLMREYKIQEALVEILTKQFEMAKLSAGKDVSPIQVIQKANVPELKSKPSRGKLVVVATTMAFFLFCILAYIRDAAKSLDSEKRLQWLALRTELLTFKIQGKSCASINGKNK